MLKREFEEENKQLKERNDYLENLLLSIWEKLEKFIKGTE